MIKEKIHYNGYLVEKAKNQDTYGLDQLLKRICQVENWKYIDNKVRLDFYRRKEYDFLIEVNDRKILIEFDGNTHYQKLEAQLNDIKFEKKAVENGYEIVRIPYFIQIDTIIFELLFDVKLKNCEITNSFPHGFISKTVILPVDFNYLGWKRLNKFLSIVPKNIKNQIINSYKEKVKELIKSDFSLREVCFDEI
jgi:hypothetical protein